jgi:hypothetical protein
MTSLLHIIAHYCTLLPISSLNHHPVYPLRGYTGWWSMSLLPKTSRYYEIRPVITIFHYFSLLASLRDHHYCDYCSISADYCIFSAVFHYFSLLASLRDYQRLPLLHHFCQLL